MPHSIQKIGMLIVAAISLETGIYLSNPLPSVAQDAGAKPPRCEGNSRNGKAKCNYEGGDNYAGNMVNGLPDGLGIYVYANGDRYEGQFRRGRPNGQGVFIFKDDY